jgi:hypothetical protein
MPATEHQVLALRSANDMNSSSSGGTPFTHVNASIQSDSLAASFLELEATDPAQQVSQ